MHTFTDKFEQSWDLDIDLYQIQRIEAHEFPTKGKIKFFPPEQNLLDIVTETETVFGMLWLLCKEQKDGKIYLRKKKVVLADGKEDYETVKEPIETEEDFARCFDGTSLDNARQALLEELAAFFPQMKTTLTRLMKMFSKGSRIVDRKVAQKMDEELSEEALEKMVDEFFKDPQKNLNPQA